MLVLLEFVVVLGTTLNTINDNSLVVAVFAPGVQCVTVVLEIVAVNALVLQTINRTEGIANLYTTVVFEVAGLIVLSTVYRLEVQAVQFFHVVEVLRHVETCLHAELANFCELAGVDINLPTLVVHYTTVHLSQSGETVCRRNADVADEQVLCSLAIDFSVNGNHVVKQTQVETHVPDRALLPTDALQREVLRDNYGVAVVHATIAVTVVLVVGTDRTVTIDTV
jgi:hypothetical protein